jgi:hypothetical protein
MSAARAALVFGTWLAAAPLVASAQDRTDDPGFAATARVPAPPERQRAIGAGEGRTLRRRLGDSFNAAETLPGTVPVFSGVPYLLVRGAPPAASSLYYDGVPVPWLFHLALGPAIAHPALMGELELHHGVAPARYGRRTGAVFTASGPSPPERSEGELALRLLDTQALMIAKSAPALSLHGRLGYPDAMLELIDSDAALSYWDYQLRAQQAFAGGTELTAVLFGAYDRVGDRREPQDDIELQFHRALLRLRHTRRDVETGAAVHLGYEQGLLGEELGARSARVGPSLWVEHSPAPGTRVRVGADLEAKLADIERRPDPPRALQPPGGQGFVPNFSSGLDFQTGPEDLLELAPLADVAERNAAGAYAELGLLPGGAVEIQTGVRADVWLAAGEWQQSADPSLLVRWRALPALALHAGIGRSHQAPISPVPIPGLSDLELDRGLQSAVQSEAGAELALPAELTLSLTGFYHRFSHLVFMELVIDCEGNTDPESLLGQPGGAARALALCEQRGLPRGDGDAYGAELLLRRDLARRVTGWASYTLAFADAVAADGTEFTPQFDVRHLLNVVLAVDWGHGFESGLTLHYRSGKPAVNTIFDLVQRRYEHLHSRLPAFFRADVNLGYGWTTSLGRLTATLQWLNLTFSREATKRDCVLVVGENGRIETDPDGRLPIACQVDFQPAIVLPNVGLRVEF